MAASPDFEVIDERRSGWDQAYTSSELIGLLRTYSNHRALPAAIRKALLGRSRPSSMTSSAADSSIAT